MADTQFLHQISKEEELNPIKQDTKKGKLRFVRNCFPHKGYLWNYGAFPQTWEDPNVVHPETKQAGDNDPLDVCEIGELVAKPGEVKQVKVLGVMALLDEGETDWKVIVIDVNDPLAPRLNDIEDVERHLPGLLRATNEWFRIYKIPDGKPENQFAFSGECKNKKYAIDVIRECAEAWEKLVTGKTPKGDINLYVSFVTARSNPRTDAVTTAPMLACPTAPTASTRPLLRSRQARTRLRPRSTRASTSGSTSRVPPRRFDPCNIIRSVGRAALDRQNEKPHFTANSCPAISASSQLVATALKAIDCTPFSSNGGYVTPHNVSSSPWSDHPYDLTPSALIGQSSIDEVHAEEVQYHATEHVIRERPSRRKSANAAHQDYLCLRREHRVTSDLPFMRNLLEIGFVCRVGLDPETCGENELSDGRREACKEGVEGLYEHRVVSCPLSLKLCQEHDGIGSVWPPYPTSSSTPLLRLFHWQTWSKIQCKCCIIAVPTYIVSCYHAVNELKRTDNEQKDQERINQFRPLWRVRHI